MKSKIPKQLQVSIKIFLNIIFKKFFFPPTVIPFFTFAEKITNF